jgi:hypothetical protein
MSPIAGLTGLGGSSLFSLIDGRLNLNGFVIQFTAIEFYVFQGVPTDYTVQNLRIYGQTTTDTEIQPYSGGIDMTSAPLLHRDVPYGTTQYEVFEYSKNNVKINFYDRANISSTQSKSVLWNPSNQEGIVFEICKGENETGRSAYNSIGKLKHRNISNQANGFALNNTGSDGCSTTVYYPTENLSIRLIGSLYTESQFVAGAPGIYVSACYSNIGIDGPLYVTNYSRHAFVNSYQLTNKSQLLYTYQDIVSGFKFGSAPSPNYTIS